MPTLEHPAPASRVNAGTSDADPIALALARRTQGGYWTRIGSGSTHDGAPRWVYQRSPSPDDTVVVSTCASGRQEVRALEVPGVGILSRWKMADDAELPTLRMFLRQHADARVLRYRPGKRATFAIGDAIAKVFAHDRGAELPLLHQRLSAVRGARLDVPTGLRYEVDVRAFWQTRVRGEPLAPRLHGGDAARCIDRVAEALAHLHGSDIRFPNITDLTHQQRRTARYVGRLHAPAPVRAAMDELCETLDACCRRLRSDGHGRTGRPLHGSPHVHQWLAQDQRLGLVNFERAGMGDPELDLAAFLAEFDFAPTPETAKLSARLLARYRTAGGQVDLPRLAFYRAHMHLAKAVRQLRASGTTAFTPSPVARSMQLDDQTGAGIEHARRTLVRANALLAAAGVGLDHRNGRDT